MSEIDDRRYDLQRRQSQNEAEQADVRRSINDLDARICKLRTAYNSMGTEKNELKDKRREVQRRVGDYDDIWKGVKSRDIYDSCSGGELNSNYGQLVNNVDDIQDAINDEIRRLNDKKAEKWGILQSLISTWNWLSTEIANCFN